MKRFLLSLAVCAALATPVLADYLVIRINLSAESAEIPGAGPGQGQGAGLPLGGGLGGPGGAASPKGSRGGGGISAAGPGQGFGAGGPGQGPPGLGGARGAGQGLGLGAGGTGQAPPGFGSGQAPPGFGPGGPGQGLGQGRSGLGARGAQGGAPGRGALRGSGGGIGLGDDALGGTPPAANQPPAPEKLTPAKGDLFIVAMEVTVGRSKNSNKVILSHKWGTTVLNPEVSIPGRATLQLITTESLEKRLEAKRQEYLVTSSPKQHAKYLEWMLQNWNFPTGDRFSMQSKFEAHLAEVASLAGTLSPQEKAKLDALLQVKAQLAQPMAPAREEEEIIKTLMTKIGKEFKPYTKGHYVVYHLPRQDREVEAKVAKMEQALAGSLYWFALQGVPLAVPSKHMVCVMADTPEKFKALRTAFDNPPLQSDGFFAPLDNITVLAPQRIDPPFERFLALANNAETSLRGHNNLDFKKLLSENPSKPYITTANSQKQDFVNAVVTGQIFALAKSAALDEGEVSTASHEALQQLVAASKASASADLAAATPSFQPRTVILPQALRDGLSSFFATPKSSGDLNLPALWTGIGGPHWIHLPLFRKLAEARKAGDKAEYTIDPNSPSPRRVKIGSLDLMSIVTDRGFDYAEKAGKEDLEFFQDKARSEAWALTYFLMYNKLDQFRKFYNELAQMPRDLELAPEVIEQAFGRSFELMDAKGERLDTAKVTRLQKEWSDYMAYVMLAVDNSEKK